MRWAAHAVPLRPRRTAHPDPVRERHEQANRLRRAGRAIAEVDQAGVTNRFEYDSLGRLTNVVDALGHNTSYGYDEAGHLVRQQDANGHVTRYEFETCCQRSATILPLGQRSTTMFNAVNSVAALTNFNGQVISYDYDLNNRLLRKTLNAQLGNPQLVTYGYTPRDAAPLSAMSWA